MCYKKTFYVDVNAFLPQNLMILKADISKTSTGRYIFLFIFICGNSKCTRIQKIKKFSGEVNWVLLALNADVTRSNVIFTTAKCPKTRRPNNERYILNKKCTNMYENEDADQLSGNSVTYQRLCSRFLTPGISIVENR